MEPDAPARRIGPDSVMGLPTEDQAEIYRVSPAITAWLTLSLLGAMAFIAVLLGVIIFGAPVRFVTVVPKSEGPLDFAPLVCSFERAVCPDLMGWTVKTEI